MAIQGEARAVDLGGQEEEPILAEEVLREAMEPMQEEVGVDLAEGMEEEVGVDLAEGMEEEVAMGILISVLRRYLLWDNYGGLRRAIEL